MNFFSNKRAWLCLLACLLFIIIIYWPWFGTLNTFTWGDWGWYFADTAKTWFDFPRIWFTGSMGGVDVSIFQYLPNRLLYGAFAQLFPFEVFDRLVFILPSAIFPIISSFLLVRYLTKSNIAASIGALTFTLSPYLVTTRTGHFTLSVSFALAPLILLFVIRSLEERKIRLSILAGLVSALAFAYEPRAFMLTWAVATAYGVYYLILVKTNSLKARLSLLVYLVIPLATLFMVHIYSFIGLFFAAKQISTTILNRALFGAGYVSINRALSMAIYFWDEYSGKPLQIIPVYFWITTLTSMAGMWLGRKNKTIVFFTLISVGGMFLNKDTNQPFGGVYLWLYKYLPGFNAFREPSKFYFFISLGYMVLTGWFVSWAIKQKSKFLAISLTIIAVLPFILNGSTIAEGRIGKMMTPRHVPEEYMILKKFLQSNPGEYRVMHVPFDSRWGYWDEHIRKSSAADFVLNEWPDLFPYRPEIKGFTYFNYTMELFERPESNYLLDMAAVRYVLVPSDDSANEDIFTFAWGKREDFLKKIQELKYLKKIDIGDTRINLFENPDWRPLIYVSNGLENFISPPTYETPKFIQVKTFHYEIQEGEKSIGGKTINYSDLYNPGWKLYYGHINWIDVLFRRKLVPHVIHSQSIIHTNQFQLSQDLDKTQTLSLYFEPQSYIYIGVIISLISLGSIAVGFIIYWARNKK